MKMVRDSKIKDTFLNSSTNNITDDEMEKLKKANAKYDKLMAMTNNKEFMFYFENFAERYPDKTRDCIDSLLEHLYTEVSKSGICNVAKEFKKNKDYEGLRVFNNKVLKREEELKNEDRVLRIIGMVNFDGACLYAEKKFEDVKYIPKMNLMRILNTASKIERTRNNTKDYKENEKNNMVDKNETVLSVNAKKALISISRNSCMGALDKFDNDTIKENVKEMVLEADKDILMTALLNRDFDIFLIAERANISNMIHTDRCDEIKKIVNEYLGNEEGKKYINEKRVNGLLENLSRGNFQNFLRDSEIDNETKLILIESEMRAGYTELFEISYDDVMKLENNSVYSEEIENFKKYIDKENNELRIAEEHKKAMSNAYSYTYDYEKNEDEEKILSDKEIDACKKIRLLELRNLMIILNESDFSQKYKWLREIKYADGNQKYFEETKDFDESSLEGIYYSVIEKTKKEFYKQMGIEYDEHLTNRNLPEKIWYGIEIEEVGILPNSEFANNLFIADVDASLENIEKESGRAMNNEVDDEINTGEYTSTILWANSDLHLEQVADQAKILNYLGAETNSSCGFHIHVSSEISQMLKEQDFSKHYKKSGLSKSFASSLSKKKKLQIPYYVTREIFDMEIILAKKFKVFCGRINGYSKFLGSREIPDFSDRDMFVNLCSLKKYGTVEFRYFNLPDHIDSKVMEAYIDFATSYYAYIEEGNNTKELFDNTIKELQENEKIASYEFTDEEKDDLMFEILKNELLLKEDTTKVIDNLDSIFEFYNVKEIECFGKELETLNEFDESRIVNYYDKYNKSIKEYESEKMISKKMKDEIEGKTEGKLEDKKNQIETMEAENFEIE